MSELSFGIVDNNADFTKRVTQLREAIDGLGADFEALNTAAESSIKGIEQFINDLRTQIDSTIEFLDQMYLENQVRLSNLQSTSLENVKDDTNASQGAAIQTEVVRRSGCSSSAAFEC